MVMEKHVTQCNSVPPCVFLAVLGKNNGALWHRGGGRIRLRLQGHDLLGGWIHCWFWSLNVLIFNLSVTYRYKRPWGGCCRGNRTWPWRWTGFSLWLALLCRSWERWRPEARWPLRHCPLQTAPSDSVDNIQKYGQNWSLIFFAGNNS